MTMLMKFIARLEEYDRMQAGESMSSKIYRSVESEGEYERRSQTGKRSAVQGSAMPYQRVTKRRKELKNTSLYDDLEELCLDLHDLSHVERRIDPLDTLDMLRDALESLDMTEPPDQHKFRPVEILLNLDLDTNILPGVRKTKAVERAIRLCSDCGLTTFRDILWYNDSLRQSARLDKLPICLAEISYKLKDWSPRKSQPDITLEHWQCAWQALTYAWPVLQSGFSHECRSVLLKKRWMQPPSGANWFEFDYCDGIFDRMEPVLCYQDHTDGNSSMTLMLPDQCFAIESIEIATSDSADFAMAPAIEKQMSDKTDNPFNESQPSFDPQDSDSDSESGYIAYGRKSD